MFSFEHKAAELLHMYEVTVLQIVIVLGMLYAC